MSVPKNRAVTARVHITVEVQVGPWEPGRAVADDIDRARAEAIAVVRKTLDAQGAIRLRDVVSTEVTFHEGILL